jgi:hypothetical protein
MMYSAPIALSVPELQDKTLGTGILVLSLTEQVSSDNIDEQYDSSTKL